MITKTVDEPTLNLQHLKKIEHHKRVVEDHKDPTDEIDKVTKIYSFEKSLNILPNLLRSNFSISGVDLSYVIREDETPPTLELLATNTPYSDYLGSLVNKLIIHTLTEDAR